MLKLTIAERILETITTSSRAASIIGDLLEETSNRSPFWFWCGLLRIFVSLICRDLQVHWLRMIWLGLSGFLELFVMACLFAYCNKLYFAEHTHLGNILFHILGYILPAFIGWHVATRSHDHEFPSAIALVFVFCIWVVGGLSLRQAMHTTLISIPFCTLFIVGAFLFRFRVNARNRKMLLTKN